MLSRDGFYGVENVPKSISAGGLTPDPLRSVDFQLVGRGIAAPSHRTSSRLDPLDFAAPTQKHPIP